MKKQFRFIPFVLILFVSCDKNNEATESESLMFHFYRYGGWKGSILVIDSMEFNEVNVGG
ncbi:MAG: hypothetical protein LBH19_03190 [Dysgonamonadaceae bacterium]|jgi:hypothetical protein|nr:hypothetical protein [Dysgonamonadaceae bacterium]